MKAFLKTVWQTRKIIKGTKKTINTKNNELAAALESNGSIKQQTKSIEEKKENTEKQIEELFQYNQTLSEHADEIKIQEQLMKEVYEKTLEHKKHQSDTRSQEDNNTLHEKTLEQIAKHIEYIQETDPTHYQKLKKLKQKIIKRYHHEKNIQEIKKSMKQLHNINKLYNTTLQEKEKIQRDINKQESIKEIQQYNTIELNSIKEIMDNIKDTLEERIKITSTNSQKDEEIQKKIKLIKKINWEKITPQQIETIIQIVWEELKTPTKEK